MKINRFEHLEARTVQIVYLVVVFNRKADGMVNDSAVLNELMMIIGASFNSDVQRIPGEVVKFINIQRILFVCNYFINPVKFFFVLALTSVSAKV